MHLAVALTCLIVPIITNTWELTNTQPFWPLLVIGCVLIWVSLVLLMQIHANWNYRRLLEARSLRSPSHPRRPRGLKALA